MTGLHHDDSEAYLGDVVSPLKIQLGAVYRILEDQMMYAISKKIGFTLPRDLHTEETNAITNADIWALAVEARCLMISGGQGWVGLPRIEIDLDLGLSPESAYVAYLRLHDKLMDECLRKSE
jgi:hypothetical protein